MMIWRNVLAGALALGLVLGAVPGQAPAQTATLVGQTAVATGAPTLAGTPVSSRADLAAAFATKADIASPAFSGVATFQDVTINGTLRGAGNFLPLGGGALTGGLSGTTGSFSGALSGATVAASGNATVGGTLAVTGTTTLTGDLLTAGRFVASSGSLRFVNNGANGFNFQNAAGGSAFTVNGSASALANQVTIVPQVAGSGPSIVATGTDTNIALKLQSKGTGAVQVNLSPFSVTPNTLTFANGSPPASSFSYVANAGGTMNTVNPNSIVSFALLGDTISKDLASGFFPFVMINKTWGGGVQQGQQQAFRVQMLQTGAVTGYTPPQNVQMSTAFFTAEYSFNLGGTAPSAGNAIGAAYSVAATTWLKPGATNYTLAANIEWDIEVDATQQILTLGGTITAGDTITLTYTSASIVGSPVAVVATAGTGDTLATLVSKIVAVVNNNAALGVAGVSAQPDSSANLVDLFWQTQNATTVVAAVGGAATETAVLGSVVPGASTWNRNNNGFASRGAGRAAAKDYVLGFGTLNATHGSSALSLFGLGVPSGPFPIAPGGSLMTVDLQTVTASGQLPVWSPQLGIGFDLRLINWTQYAGAPLASPGFNIGGTGNLNLQNAVISVTSTGLVLDVPSGRIGTGNPAIVSGGSGAAGASVGHYYRDEIVQGVNGTDLNGGQYLITSVDASTGSVTGLTTLVPPSTTTASLGVAIPTIGGSGIGLTITPTAATNNGVSIAPTGGPTTVGGSLAVTGTITGPTTTQAVDANTTALASTAFVLGQAAAATPLINGTAAVGTSTRYARADHVHPTDTTRAALAGATFTGQVAVGSNTTQQILEMNGPVANRTFLWATANSKRWQFLANGTAEGGANAGSDFQIQAFDDSGALLTTPLTITRSTGLMNFATGLKFSGSNVVANGAIATTMTSLGPTGSHTTIQEWLQVQNSAGTTRYIPLY